MRAACALVVGQRPSLAVTPGGAHAHEEASRRGAVQWRCISAERGAYLEGRQRHARQWAAELSLDAARHFLETTHAWLTGANAADARRAAEAEARARRELRFFEDEELGRIAAPTAGGGGGAASNACVICLETPEADVGVLPCGHVAGCAACVRQWVALSSACPTCRRPARLQDVSFVLLAGALPPASAPAATAVDPHDAARWGTKPAAIVAHLRRVLRDGGSRVIVFSAFDNCLALLAATFEAAGVRAVRCEGDAAARHAAIAAFSGTAPPATTAATPAGVAPPPRVLLLSSKHNASGTNLQCANHVLFVEPPGTNPRDAYAVETQAILVRVRVEVRARARARF